MVSETFKAAIQADLKKLDQAAADDAARKEAERRAAENDRAWFAEHVEHQIESAVETLQAVDPNSRIFSIRASADRPRSAPAGLNILITIHHAHVGSYTRVASCQVSGQTVELIADGSSYANQSFKRSDVMPAAARCSRSQFTVSWLIQQLETFVMHTKMNPKLTK